jgi:hypothetical protein
MLLKKQMMERNGHWTCDGVMILKKGKGAGALFGCNLI